MKAKETSLFLDDCFFMKEGEELEEGRARWLNEKRLYLRPYGD